VSYINDPARIQEQYADESNLEARRSLYANATGPDPRELVFDAIREIEPQRVLEVGGGPGELAARVRTELLADVVMLDIAPRMVELARQKDVEAIVGTCKSFPSPTSCSTARSPPGCSFTSQTSTEGLRSSHGFCVRAGGSWR